MGKRILLGLEISIVFFFLIFIPSIPLFLSQLRSYFGWSVKFVAVAVMSWFYFGVGL